MPVLPKNETPQARPRLAVITGASQGLGQALAAALARRGYSLVIDARRADRLEAAATALATSTTVIAVAGDVTDAGHRRALAAAAARAGHVDVLINNASTLGESPLPPLARASPRTYLRTFDVNAVAPIALFQELHPHLSERATIVNITSDAAVEPYAGWGVYGSAKAALEHASRVLAAEHPELRVLVVDPGDMRTEMHQDAFPGEDISDRPGPEASAEGIVALIEGAWPGGRYSARDALEHEAPR